MKAVFIKESRSRTLGPPKFVWIGIPLLIWMSGFLASPCLEHAVLQFGPAARVQNLPYRYDVKVELVALFATVLDRSGRLVTGLNQNDFVIYDDGEPQVISQFSRDYIPLSVLILLDTSGSMTGSKLDNAQKSLVQFLRSLNRGDEAMLMIFQARPHVVQAFTQDFAKIQRALKPLEGVGSTALYDAILAGLDQIQTSHNRRRTILLISDGINTYGRARLEDTMISLKRRGVELFAIGLETELDKDARDNVLTKSILVQLTRSAGGESFIVSDSRDLGRICHTISEQMHNQYSFGYYPPRTKEGEWRSIRLETKAHGLKVVASKTGYYASAAN